MSRHLGADRLDATRQRADQLGIPALADLEAGEAIERARALILAGEVPDGDRPVTKAGDLVAADAVLRLRNEPMPYVSRGGVKLAHALQTFAVDPRGLVAVDVGRFDKNLAIPARYGIHDRLKGVPALLVVDPKADRLLNAADVSALSDARHMSPQGLADYLARWTG